MTAQELKDEIYKVCRRDWEIELAPLMERLRQLDTVECFHLLFQFAAHSQSDGPAAPTALLLRRLNLRCPISCRQAIEEMLTDWDISIQEVPFYLAEQFGVAAVRAEIAELGPSITDKDQITRLGTIEYWLSCYEEMQNYLRLHGTP